MKVVKVLNGSVQLEDGRVRNLRHVSLFKASNLPQESVRDDLDEESGYLWGYEDVRGEDDVVRRSHVECDRHSIYDTRPGVREVAVGERSGPDIAPVMYPLNVE
ncbi:hypothetical protein NDU88_006488 [Pleurodeles waltl]|uniref:Uncharacterized protein n=1 Tax=Pleurodeles waltl TaxID=8319 RepID=A0AAV7WXR0_PLEWA|nr:hypothetical protein NDU88_006488 [Pleurodeles waltl]